jgi:hypothetical protein
MLYLSGHPQKYEETVVVSDEVQMYTQAETLLDGLMVLLAVYYVFDLAYPKIYSKLLGILQEYIINEPFTGGK